MQTHPQISEQRLEKPWGGVARTLVRKRLAESTRTQKRRTNSRTGMVLAGALICLLVVMLFAAAVVQAIVTRQRASRTDEQQIQCLLLTESALARAKAQLQNDPEFRSETWTPSLDDRGISRTAVASIRVEAVPDEPMQRKITVQVHWPDDPLLRIQRIKEITFTLPVPGGTS